MMLAVQALIYAFFTVDVDYCNVILYGVFQQLQAVANHAQLD